MHEPALLAAMQAFASIELRNAVYVACPISSGRREFDLMLAAGRFDRSAVRTDLGAQWQREVLDPNRAEARATATRIRVRYPERNVINPSEFDIDGLDQPGYDALCERIIRGHVDRIVLADGWQFSRGARVEATLAVDLSIPMEDTSGAAVGPSEVLRACQNAESDLVDAGFPVAELSRLLPSVGEAAAT